MIFENHQERLEKFTEALHGLSEKPLEDLQDTSVRTQIVNYTRVVERVSSVWFFRLIPRVVPRQCVDCYRKWLEDVKSVLATHPC